MVGLSNSKFALRQHLLHLGFSFGVSREVVSDRLNNHMGAERAKIFNDLVCNKDLTGEDRQNAIYDFLNDLIEANLLRSLDTDVTLDTSHIIYEKAVPYFTAGARVLELGCWTGGFSSFIAEQHPDCTVTGVDRASKMIDICKGLYRFPNLSFLRWDYREGRPSLLPRADVLLCSLGTNYNCPSDVYGTFDSTSVRLTRGYRCEKHEAWRYFRHWRRAAKRGAPLLAVLRTVTFPRFLAFLDAAQEAGWTPLLSECTAVACSGNNEHLPFFAFRAERTAVVIDEDCALSHFTRLMNRTDRWGTLTGPVAMSLYRSLGNRRILATKEERDKFGRLIVEELGICGSFGYLYRHDTFPNVDLSFFSRALVEDVFQKSLQPTGESTATQ